VAAQDQAVNTNYLKNKILKEENGSKCLRMLHSGDE
jgi:hypothetical protein